MRVDLNTIMPLVDLLHVPQVKGFVVADRQGKPVALISESEIFKAYEAIMAEERADPPTTAQE